MTSNAARRRPNVRVFDAPLDDAPHGDATMHTDDSMPPVLPGLAPIGDARARVLILGSFPGEASLAAAQYYGHPRNHFWRLVGAVIGVPLQPLAYAERVACLTAHGIALWDVIARCEREGSLDSAIRAEVGNDIGGLLRGWTDIGLIAFNGGKSASYRKRVAAIPEAARCTLAALPSSSPANATHGIAVKEAAWIAALRPALQSGGDLDGAATGPENLGANSPAR